MHLPTLSALILPVLLALPQSSSAINIVVSNDDGWAEANIRALYNSLVSAGNSVVLSAPADNESGTGSRDAEPTKRTSACEFNSCPAGSPAYGKDASNPRLNYVNSYPVTSMRYGIQNVSQTFFGGKPDLAVAGFNVGANLGGTVQISGTVGAATEAAKEGVPALAFSGSSGSQISYTTSPTPNYVNVYTSLSRNVTQTLIASGKPYLPSNIWLNVNYPESTSSSCSSASQFKFVLSRINSTKKSRRGRTDERSTAGADVKCAGTLPTETNVVNHDGCYASISVGVADTKMDADASTQALVQKKLNTILSCLPSGDTRYGRGQSAEL